MFSDKPRARAVGEETRGVGNTRVVAARMHAPDDGELLLELGGVAIEALAVGADHEPAAATRGGQGGGGAERARAGHDTRARLSLIHI